MSLNLFCVGFLFYVKRMIRDYFSTIIFVALPVVLVFVLGFAHTHGSGEEDVFFNGYNMASTHLAIGMAILFQLNGGIYLLHFLNNDLFKSMKWKLKVSPCPTYVLIFSGIAACLVFTFLQGALIVVITSLLLDAYWGSFLVTFAVIFLISVISLLINILLLIFIKDLNTAEHTSWVISSVMSILGGFILPLPDTPFFKFMEQYGTPFALARNAILESGFGATGDSVQIYILLLVAVILVLTAIAIPLSRRKLA